MTGRRWLTWLVVAGLSAIGLAAAVDALRDEPEVVRAEAEIASVPGAAADSGQAVAQLRQARVSGVLTYSDEDCRLHAVSLPELEPVEAPSFEMCRPVVSNGGLGVVDGDVVWSGLGYRFAQVVLSSVELSRSILGGPAGADRGFRAVQAVSLDDGRMLVLADSRGLGERVVAAFDGPRAEFAHLSWQADNARAIRPSPQGRYYAIFRGAPPSVRVFTRDGRTVEPTEGTPRAWAVTWSPDERWTALAASDGVWVFPSERPRGPVIRIPLDAHDLAWAEGGLASSP
jgi:hypothetical protein